MLLVARHSSIEPLGIHYLAGLARDNSWACRVILVKGCDFSEVYDEACTWQPDFVGFQVWTGYHLAAFEACDRLWQDGYRVIIGGPHATYFTAECEKHADYVVKGEGFAALGQILRGELAPGVHFIPQRLSDGFPMPDRSPMYERYPEFAASPIKSIICSIGCPFQCTYCYAPTYNEIYGGFKLNMRPVADVIREAKEILARWPTRMIYFQDDIFGFNLTWLKEFVAAWCAEVGVPWHCQIRLELTRNEAGDRRLDLFAEGGCSGITLAIESGNAFLRDHVLFRHMDEALILEGCAKIKRRGMTLRTEQILAVPFSDLETELSTLTLNAKIQPEMAWTSILSPFRGTAIGEICHNFGLYGGNNDDLDDSFFNRSILRHVGGGCREIAGIVYDKLGATPTSKALLDLRADDRVVVHRERGPVGRINYLDDRDNDNYHDQIMRLQRLFIFLSRIHRPVELARRLMDCAWQWSAVSNEIRSHLGGSSYFSVFAGGEKLAETAADLDCDDPEFFDRLSTATRHHVFHHELYKIA